MQSTRTYYEILNISSNAGILEIKRNYLALILKYHPDKLHPPNDSTLCDPLQSGMERFDQLQIEEGLKGKPDNDPNDKLAGDHREFDLVLKAWTTLKDPDKRKEYDAELLMRKFRTENNIYTHLYLSDMKCIYNPELGKMYTYACRCGGEYIVDHITIQKIFKPYYTTFDKACCTKIANDAANVNTVAGVFSGPVDDTEKDEEERENEFLLECSSCSLSIILRE